MIPADAIAPSAPAGRARSRAAATNVKMSAARVAASGKPIRPMYSHVMAAEYAGARRGPAPTPRTMTLTRSATTPT